MPGAQCARSVVCKIVSTRHSHHGHTGNTRHSPRNGFNGFLRALLGDRAFLSPSLAENRQLDTGIEVSGPHDFAVRGKRLRLCAAASTASRPTSVTIAKRPSQWDGISRSIAVSPKRQSEIFFEKGLDTKIAGQPVRQIRSGPVGPKSPRLQLRQKDRAH